MSNIEYPATTKFFTWKGLNATEISKELDSVYKNDALFYRTIATWVAEFKEPERGFEDSPGTGRPSTIITNENIEALERIVMHDRQFSVCRVAYEVPIPTTTIYEIMSNHLDMKKLSVKWTPKLFIPIQRVNHVDCFQELLQENKLNSDKYFHRIVTGDET